MKNKNKDIITSTIAIYITLIGLLLFFGGMIIVNAQNIQKAEVVEQIVVEDVVIEDESIVEEEIIEEEPTTQLLSIGEFRLTGYCPCEKCCGQWAGGPTYSGVMPTANHTIAVDTDVIPLGTHVWINGQEYVAEDTGSAIIGNRIDIYCDTHEECFSEFCNGYADVYVEVK